MLEYDRHSIIFENKQLWRIELNHKLGHMENQQ